MSYERELSVAKTLAIEAGKKIMEVYRLDNINFERKDDDSPLTKADLGANKVIMEGLRAEFPTYGFLTEEEADSDDRLGKELVWIIDPLDGTKEFIRKRDDFTVNIGLVRKNEPVLGVVYLPKREELFYAVKGEAGYVQRNGSVEQIHVSEAEDPSEMCLVTSKSHSTQKEERLRSHFKKYVQAGSSLKGCLVAEGNADVYCRYGPVREWDVCAMNAIINGAGGKMTDLEGQKLKYNQKDTLITGFIASNDKLHSKLVKIANG